MSRQPRAGGLYVPPLDIAASQSAAADVYLGGEGPRGKFTLVAATRYAFILGGADAPFESAHFQWDASIIITSLTIEDSNFSALDAPNYSTTAGDWIDEDPVTAFVGVVGAGATVSSGVVAVAGGAAGGAMFHIGETSAFRTRINVLVGATGGLVRCGAHGKM